MQFEDIIVNYYLELETLYKEKISADPILFDSDKQSHGYTCTCCRAPQVNGTIKGDLKDVFS